MYRVYNIQGDGIVDDSCQCDPNNADIPISHPITGNLGVQSGCCPLPDSCRQPYKINNSYQLMKDKPQDIVFLNKLGLHPMPDYKILGGKGYFYGSDGRVVDSMRGIRMTLDQPAKIGAVDMDNVYKIDNRGYAGIYKTYSDINNGQISYYVDKSISQPFYEPVYTLSSMVDKTIFLPLSSNI
jgi:hypothetical protein